MARGICHGSSQSDAITRVHSQSFREIQPVRSTDFARNAFGVRCVFASLSSGQTDFRLRCRRFVFLRDKRESRRDRMMALQPNKKIKDPHAPANGEAIADISAKHCVHCWRKPKHIARRQKHFDEFLRVPRVDKTEIDIHRSINCALITREEALRLSRMSKNFAKNVRALLAAEHSQENAAAKNWIDETGGIACKQPAVAMQSCAAIGEVRFNISLRRPPCAHHPFCDDRLFRQRLFEKVFGAQFRFAKSFTVENHSNASALGGEWN